MNPAILPGLFLFVCVLAVSFSGAVESMSVGQAVSTTSLAMVGLCLIVIGTQTTFLKGIYVLVCLVVGGLVLALIMLCLACLINKWEVK